MILQTKRLTFVLSSTEDILQQIEQLSAEDRGQVSPVWLARVQTATEPSPWTHGFAIVLRDGGVPVGHAAFKGPPTDEGVVEIAYGIAPDHQGQGYATEAAKALTIFAFATGCIRVVCAHTKPEGVASARVLAKCGFQNLGEVIDPEDGNVWRWETNRGSSSNHPSNESED